MPVQGPVPTLLSALPPIIAAAAVLVIGISILRRERRSTIGVQFFLATIFLDIWLWALAGLMTTTDPGHALVWAKVGYLGVPFIPASLCQAIAAISPARPRYYRAATITAWLIAGGFALDAVFGSRFVTGVTHFSWGYYPQYGSVSGYFLLFFLLVILVSLAQLIYEWNRAESETAERRRLASLLTAFGIGCIAAVDFLPKFGIGVYPVGYFGIIFCLAIMAYVIWRDRPVSITPALAAPEILETMSDAVLVLDNDGTVRVANAAAAAFLDRPARDLVGRPIRRILEGGPLGEALGALPRGGKLSQAEFTHQARTVNVAATMMKRHDGAPLAVVIVLRDLTESRKLEQQMQQAQKMEAIGQLAGGIAHDLNNILQVVLANTETMRLDRPEHDAPIQQIQEAARRGGWLTRRLLEFARRQILEPVVLDVSVAVHEMQPMLQRLVGEHIQIALVLGDGQLLVRSDRGQVEQILLNLVVNSRDAMPRGGRITIETRPDPSRTHAVLTVSDTGTGMDEATRARMFEPFFSTKGTLGTGLGLSTVYGIVKQNGGQVEVETALGAGTTFTITLPRLAQALVSGPSRADGQNTRGSETILLVEDDPAVRSSTRRTLERAGYHVIDAEHGGDAVERAAAYNGGIHLMLTDVAMPGIPVTEMIQHLGATRPEMELLFMSGFSDDAVVRHGVEQSGAGFLQKPFEISDLLVKVRHALDRKAGSGRP